MRTTKVAESGGVSVANGDPRGVGAGYSLKPNPNTAGRGDGSAMRMQRGNWEVRLGRLQVVVWLGLSIGACFGGYSVGFFAGRYVGFESAREASIGEVPKLPVPEILSDNSVLNPNRVYDRLREPAVLVDSGSPRASARMGGLSGNSRPHSGVIQQDKVARGAAQLPKQSAAASDTTGAEEVVVDEEDIFSDSNDRLVIGSDDVEVKRDSLPSSVRVLGAGAKLEVAKGAVDNLLVTQNDEKSQNLAAVEAPAQKVLEERIATARSGALATKGEVVEKPGVAGGLVRRSLPVGYFAQVAAPKKLSEAEGVAKRLKKAGFPVLVESATVNGQSFYRVVVGPEENKVQVERLVTQLQKESLAGGSKPFIRRVK